MGETVSMAVQLNGKFIKNIDVPVDNGGKDSIELAALNATGFKRDKARVVIVPGRLANVIPN